MLIFATRSVLALAITALCAVPGSALAQAKSGAPAKKLYCWDQGGQRICSDTLPPEAVNSAREEFNSRSGLRSGEVDRALTAEERAEAAAQAAQAQADQAAIDTRKRTEQAMLATFQSEDELRRVFTERVGIVDNHIQTARYNLTSLREGLATLLRTAGDRELAGQKVDDKKAQDISQRHRELWAQQRLLGSFERQRVALDAEIEETVARYRVLKGVAAMP
jgi:hypothetical protein